MLITQDLIKVYKLHAEAQLPYKATAGSAGYDIKTVIDKPITLKKGIPYKFPTGLSLCMPHNKYEVQLRSRSSLALKGIMLIGAPCTIDSDYYGEISVVLMNLMDVEYQISPGERIAQIVFNQVYHPQFELVDAPFIESTRTGGWGSTGTH